MIDSKIHSSFSKRQNCNNSDFRDTKAKQKIIPTNRCKIANEWSLEEEEAKTDNEFESFHGNISDSGLPECRDTKQQ